MSRRDGYNTPNWDMGNSYISDPNNTQDYGMNGFNQYDSLNQSYLYNDHPVHYEASNMRPNIQNPGEYGNHNGFQPGGGMGGNMLFQSYPQTGGNTNNYGNSYYTPYNGHNMGNNMGNNLGTSMGNSMGGINNQNDINMSQNTFSYDHNSSGLFNSTPSPQLINSAPVSYGAIKEDQDEFLEMKNFLSSFVTTHQSGNQAYKEVFLKDTKPKSLVTQNSQDNLGQGHHLQTLGPDFPIRHRDEPDKIIAYWTKKIEEIKGTAKEDRNVELLQCYGKLEEELQSYLTQVKEENNILNRKLKPTLDFELDKLKNIKTKKLTQSCYDDVFDYVKVSEAGKRKFYRTEHPQVPDIGLLAGMIYFLHVTESSKRPPAVGHKFRSYANLHYTSENRRTPISCKVREYPSTEENMIWRMYHFYKGKKSGKEKIRSP